MTFISFLFEVEVIDKKTRKPYSLEVYASSKKEIEERLEAQYIVKHIHRVRSELEESAVLLFAKSIQEDDILQMLDFLAQALKRGVRIKKALEFLIASEEKEAMRALLKRMHKRLEVQFSSYYDIFKAFPEYFDYGFLGIVRAGESTGNLAENILQYTKERRKMLNQKKQINKVFLKRGILFSVVLLIALIIITFVIPQFAKLFENSGSMPIILNILSSVAAFFQYYGLYIMLIILGSILGIIGLIKYSYNFKKHFDKTILQLPLLGNIVRTYYTCQYLYFTGTLLMKNVNYIRIMDILIEQTQNIPFKEVFSTIKENIGKGIPLHEMLRKSEENLHTHYAKIPKGYLLPSLSQALEMGAATGNMGHVLYDAFLSYEVVLQDRTKRAIKVFDSVFYSFIVVIMGLLFFAMGSAMSALYQNAGAIV